MSGMIKTTIQTEHGTKKVEIPLGNFSIGRSKKADLIIDNAHLSRIHVFIKFHENDLYMLDNGTTNGSFINENKVTENRWYKLTSGDFVRLGKEKIILNFVLEVEVVKKDIDDVIQFKTPVSPRNISEDHDTTRTFEIPKEVTKETVLPFERNEDSTQAWNIAPEVSPQVKQTSQERPSAPAPTPSLAPSNLQEKIQVVTNMASTLEAPELSEVQLLQIKKLEIDSQVAAIKIMEDAEAKAIELVEQAKIEASSLEHNSIEKVKDSEDKINALHTKIDDLSQTINALESEAKSLETETENSIYQRDQLNISISNKKEELASTQIKNKKEIQNFESYSKQIKNEHEQKIEELKLKHDSDIVDFEELATGLKETHDIEMNQMIHEEERLYESKITLNSEIEKEQEQLDKLNTQISDLKQRETNVHDLYKASQERFDKLQNDKDYLSNDLKNMDIQKERLEDDVKVARENLNNINIQITDSQKSYHKSLADIEKHLTDEKKSIQSQLEDFYQQQEEKKEKILQHTRTIEDDIISKAHSKASGIEQIATDMLGASRVQKQECDQYEMRIRKELETESLDSIAYVNKLKTETEIEVNKLRDTAVLEYEETMMIAKDKSSQFVSTSKAKSQEIMDKSIIDSKALIKEAKLESQEILAQTKIESDNIYKLANETHSQSKLQASSSIEQAQTKANNLIQSAQDKTVLLHTEGLKALEERKDVLTASNENVKLQITNLNIDFDELEIEFNNLKEQYDNERERFHKEIETHRSKIVTQAKLDAGKVSKSAQLEFDQKLEACQKAQDLLAQKAQEQRDSSAKIEKIKHDTLMQEEKNILGRLRAQEVENLKQLREKEEKNIRQMRLNNIDQLAKNIESLVNIRLQKFSKTHLKSEDIKLETKAIKELVAGTLSDNKNVNQSVMKLVNPYGRFGIGKSTVLMKRLSIGFGVIALMAVLHFIFPGIATGIKDQVTDIVKVDNSAKDLYLESLREERKNRPTFSPTITGEFKDSLTDNVVYTTDFSKNWLSDSFQQKWAVKVDEVIVYKLQLPDQRVVKFIAQEFKTIRNLQKLRDKIKINTQEDQIKQMRVIEEQGVQNLKNILGGEKNYLVIKKIQKSFYRENFK